MENARALVMIIYITAALIGGTIGLFTKFSAKTYWRAIYSPMLFISFGEWVGKWFLKKGHVAYDEETISFICTTILLAWTIYVFSLLVAKLWQKVND